MLTLLENIRIESLKHQPARKSINGSEVHGHFRTINGQRVWIEAFSRNAYQRSCRRA